MSYRVWATDSVVKETTKTKCVDFMYYIVICNRSNVAYIILMYITSNIDNLFPPNHDHHAWSCEIWFCEFKQDQDLDVGLKKIGRSVNFQFIVHKNL